jgi:hypothetical protein
MGNRVQEADIMLKRTAVALSIAVLAFTAAAAQESATITLRSGERISGQLVDMGGAGFQVRVSGQDRTIPTGEVAAIEFGGSSMSAGDWDRVSSGQHVIWLRNGEVLVGELVDVGGTSPLRISVKVGDQTRDLTSNEVSKIALARPSSASTGSTAGTSGGTTTITVPGTQRWTPTGISVRRGEPLRFRAEGSVRIDPNSSDRASPAGVGSFDRRAPLPRTNAGALLGRIGNGEPFGIGPDAQFDAPGTGQLFLGINDSNVSDNEGSFTVTIERLTIRSRR